MGRTSSRSGATGEPGFPARTPGPHAGASPLPWGLGKRRGGSLPSSARQPQSTGRSPQEPPHSGGQRHRRQDTRGQRWSLPSRQKKPTGDRQRPSGTEGHRGICTLPYKRRSVETWRRNLTRLGQEFLTGLPEGVFEGQRHLGTLGSPGDGSGSR
ncbi:hypothetical protein Q9966_015771 [Columba livia]|nr:hypothetical protein Q9966_015771 [Columba livia]